MIFINFIGTKTCLKPKPCGTNGKWHFSLLLHPPSLSYTILLKKEKHYVCDNWTFINQILILYKNDKIEY
jgi:hypothetical protein